MLWNVCMTSYLGTCISWCLTISHTSEVVYTRIYYPAKYNKTLAILLLSTYLNVSLPLLWSLFQHYKYLHYSNRMVHTVDLLKFLLIQLCGRLHVLSEEVLELQKSLFGAPGSVLIKTSLVKSQAKHMDKSGRGAHVWQSAFLGRWANDVHVI